MLRRTIVPMIAAALLGTNVGCTVYPDKPPTLATTTSAEQVERLYWKSVQRGVWQQAAAMQGPSVLFTNRNGSRLTGQQWIEWLKQKTPAEYLIGEVKVTPQGADTMVSYDASVTDAASTLPVSLAVVSVWQQVSGKLIMVAHSETPRAPAAN